MPPSNNAAVSSYSSVVAPFKNQLRVVLAPDSFARTETKAHKLPRAISRAERGRGRGAMSVRRWRRNRLRQKKKVKIVFFWGGGVLLCCCVVCFTV